jgi:ParB/RepB/Spo0J family partition protein
MPRYELLKFEQLVEPEIPARGTMDEVRLAELCESVKAIGFIQPLAVALVSGPQGSASGQRRAAAKNSPARASARYEIGDGHRRYKVAQMLSIDPVPCLIFPDLETARQAVKLHANLFREDLSVAEEAAFIADLIGKYDYTEEQLCAALRCKPSWINERIMLLRGNKDVFQALQDRKINLAVAKQLNRVKDEGHTRYLLSLAVEGGATALTVSQWVTEFLRPKESSPTVIATETPAVDSPKNPAAGVSCCFCFKPDNPYNMVNVWVHEWELKMIQANIARAAQVDPAELAASESQNGR